MAVVLPEERRGQPHRWLVQGAMCPSLLLIVMDNTIVNVALSTLQRDLGASTGQLQWVVGACILVFAGPLLTMGSLGDRFGRRGALAPARQRPAPNGHMCVTGVPLTRRPTVQPLRPGGRR